MILGDLAQLRSTAHYVFLIALTKADPEQSCYGLLEPDVSRALA
jgi:hypothetical protein